MIKKVVILFLLIFLVAGCQEEPAQTPQATSAPQSTATTELVAQATLPAATPTLAPTNTAAPIVIPVTPTPIPTATLPPEPSATPTPAAVSLLTPEDFGTDRNPLTGELVEDPTILLRRPVAVKISNWPPEYVRPQSGLSAADIVFEHATEGPIPRFTAIFYSQTPPKVGPIRSARLIDVEIPAMYDSGLAFSGASIGVSAKLGGSDFRQRLLRADTHGFYRTGEDKPYEHTLYAEAAGFWQTLTEVGQNVAPTYNRSRMIFTSQPPAGGSPVTAFQINYERWTHVNWQYDPQTNRYLRSQDDQPFIDANTNEQITAVNVVVVYALHQLDMNICEYQTATGCNAFSTEIQLWGQGQAVIFRDGLRYDVTWKRENRYDMLTFYDPAGNPVPLQIGNIWFQVVALHYTNALEVSN